MSNVILHLGSNIDDRIGYIQQAFERIEVAIGPIVATSSFYETEPWGNKDQGSFINIAIEVETYLSPFELLEKINKIEGALLRKRVIEWGERTIDIDIIDYENFTLDSMELTIPHKYMSERNFVLIPLYEMFPNWTHPISKKSIAQLIAESTDDGIVRKLSIDIMDADN